MTLPEFRKLVQKHLPGGMTVIDDEIPDLTVLFKIGNVEHGLRTPVDSLMLSQADETFAIVTACRLMDARGVVVKS